MRVLIDECIDYRLKAQMPGHDVWTVKEMGWVGKKNGELLREMANSSFEVLLTVDKSIPFQQNILKSSVALVLLSQPRMS